jgi:hypothetical protein
MENAIATIIAKMSMATSNSIKVNPELLLMIRLEDADFFLMLFLIFI